MALTEKQKEEIERMLEEEDDDMDEEYENAEYIEKYGQILEIWEYYNNIWADDVKEKWFVEKIKKVIEGTY